MGLKCDETWNGFLTFPNFWEPPFTIEHYRVFDHWSPALPCVSYFHALRMTQTMKWLGSWVEPQSGVPKEWVRKKTPPHFRSFTISLRHMMSWVMIWSAQWILSVCSRSAQWILIVSICAINDLCLQETAWNKTWSIQKKLFNGPTIPILRAPNIPHWQAVFQGNSSLACLRALGIIHNEEQLFTSKNHHDFVVKCDLPDWKSH